MSVALYHRWSKLDNRHEFQVDASGGGPEFDRWVWFYMGHRFGDNRPALFTGRPHEYFGYKLVRRYTSPSADKVARFLVKRMKKLASK